MQYRVIIKKISKFFERYGGKSGQNNYRVREATEDIIARSTVRDYKMNKRIPEELFQKLICAAQSAPTSSMAQAWSVIAITDLEIKKKIISERKYALHLGILENSAIFQTDPNPLNVQKAPDHQNKHAIVTCDRLLIWLVDMSKLNSIYNNNNTGSSDKIKTHKNDAKEGIDLMNFQFRSIIDATIAAQTFAMCAELEGIGVMYAGGFRTMDLRELLNLPEYVMPLFGMTIGYPNHRPRIKPRMPQDMVVHYNTYKAVPFEKLQSYNTTLKNKLEFYNQYDWFDRMITRTLPNPENYHYSELAASHGFKFK
jgi:FMN reductase (NADPH)